MVATSLLVAELAPVELHLLTRCGLVTPDWVAAGFGRAQWRYKGFELADTTTIAEWTQAFEHSDTIEQMVLAHPALDLLLEWIQLHRLGRSCGRYGCPTYVLAHGVARQP